MAADLALSSIDKSTLRQYATSLKQWQEFCTRKNLDFFEVKTKHFLKFLVERYNAGASYGILNSCRSAISLVSKTKIGEHPNVKRVMKGVFRQRPPRPKYESTWDVSIVLEYLEKFNERDLDLEKITLKTVMLLALSTAQRAQTITKIRLSNIKRVPDGLEIRIPDLLKTSGPGRFQSVLQLPFLWKSQGYVL